MENESVTISFLSQDKFREIFARHCREDDQRKKVVFHDCSVLCTRKEDGCCRQTRSEKNTGRHLMTRKVHLSRDSDRSTAVRNSRGEVINTRSFVKPGQTPVTKTKVREGSASKIFNCDSNSFTSESLFVKKISQLRPQGLFCSFMFFCPG